MSSKTTHTPGPWKYCFESVDPEGTVVTAAGGAIVANVNSETGPDATSAPAMRQMPADANARLIAAAPDLLEILRHVLTRLDLEPVEAVFPCSAMREDIRAAIVKASA